MTEPLTPEVLRDLILQCLEDFELIMPLPIDKNEAAPPLPAEPRYNEDPPEVLSEGLGNIVARLKKLKPEEQGRICNALGFYQLDDVVAFIHKLQKAIKAK